LKEKKTIRFPGGSVSNIIAGIALLGGNTAYIGGVGDDEHGKEYLEKTVNTGVSDLFIQKKGATGKCLTFITKDGERTFAVNLGQCNFVSQEEINTGFETKIMLIEGYKLEHDVDYHTAVKLVKYAKQIGAKVALDVNDAGVIKRLGDKLVDFVKEYVDILFMNEDEAEALTGFMDEKALTTLEKICELTVLKVGEKGSFVRTNNETLKVMPKKVDLVVNTNGAGDAYAAAFLFGIINKMTLAKIGELASKFAACVVSKQEARLMSLPEEIKALTMVK